MAIEIIVGASILLLLLIHYFAGRVKGFEINFLKPNDTYESINYREEGRVSGPYYIWEEGSSVLEMQFEAMVDYSASWYLGKSLGENLELVVRATKLPDFANEGIYLKTPDGKMFSHNNPLKTSIYPPGNGKSAFNFRIVIEKSLYAEIRHPQMIRFDIEYHFSGSRFLFFKVRKSGKKTNTVFAGPDLGGLWLAIDPGTTATCIATGSLTDNITLQPADTRFQDGESDAIIPSFISLKKNYDYQVGESLLRVGEGCALTGYAAKGFEGDDVEVFQSIKKLLGYKDRKAIKFNNEAILELDGADLTTLLVRGMTREFKKFIESNSYKHKDMMPHSSGFLPQRIVVAIPNNFTASKIQDLVDCLHPLGQFKEIRCISESEAVLCYYVHHHQTLNKDKGVLDDETVLVFDMGGATINLTVGDTFITTQPKKRYHIEVDAKMGYGIGGDTIDYCLARLFFDHVDEYPELKPFNPFKDMKSLSQEEQEKQKQLRIRVKNVMERLKIDIIKNMKDANRKELLKPFDIQSRFNSEFGRDGLSLFIRQDSKLYDNYFNGSGLRLVSYKVFQELVFQPIEDAIEELSKVSDLSILDTVILSGRSTLFPGVLTAVEQKIKKLTPADRKVRIIPLDKERAKTAVVRGACWFAANRGAIVLSHHKVSSQFGIRRRVGGEKDEIDFIKLIPMGAVMDKESISGTAKLRDSFDFDNHTVQFFQVMGADAKQAFIKGQKHKYSKIGSLRPNFEVREAKMEIWYDDTVKGQIRMSNGEDLFLDKATTLKDQEIADANEEHYTWIVN